MSGKKKAGLSHPHDLLVRNFLTAPDLAADLFKNYLSDEWVSQVDFDSLRCEPAEAVDRRLSELLGDLRYSAKFKDAEGDLEVFVFLEHQSRPDRFMSFRLLEYVCAAYRRRLSEAGKRKIAAFPFPLAVVLHHGKTPWKEVLPMRDLINARPGLSSDILRFPICLIDLARIPGEQLRGHPAVCALLDSLQSASAGCLPEHAKGIFGRLRAVRGESRLKEWTMALAAYYAAIQGRIKGTVDDLVNILKTVHSDREADEMALTIAEELMLEGKAEGRAEGKIEAVVFILESRFGTVPTGLKKKLTAMTDLKRIEKTMKSAMNCQNLEAFQKSL